MVSLNTIQYKTFIQPLKLILYNEPNLHNPIIREVLVKLWTMNDRNSKLVTRLQLRITGLGFACQHCTLIAVKWTALSLRVISFRQLDIYKEDSLKMPNLHFYTLALFFVR